MELLGPKEAFEFIQNIHSVTKNQILFVGIHLHTITLRLLLLDLQSLEGTRAFF